MHLRIPHFSRIVTYSATGFIVGTVVGVGMSVHALEALAFFIAISALIALVFLHTKIVRGVLFWRFSQRFLGCDQWL